MMPFFNSKNGDREYDASAMREYLKTFFTNGVQANSLEVVRAGGMKINVLGGYVHINGAVRYYAEAQQFNVEIAGTSADRIDTVVAEYNEDTRQLYTKVVRGQYSKEPSPTPLVRTDKIYQVQLAQIYIKALSTSIDQEGITDTRNDDIVCGYVRSKTDSMVFSQMLKSFDAYFAETKQKDLNEFHDFINKYDADILSDEDAAIINSRVESTKETTTTYTNKQVTDYQNKVDNRKAILESGEAPQMSHVKVYIGNQYDPVFDSNLDYDGRHRNNIIRIPKEEFDKLKYMIVQFEVNAYPVDKYGSMYDGDTILMTAHMHRSFEGREVHYINQMEGILEDARAKKDYNLYTKDYNVDWTAVTYTRAEVKVTFTEDSEGYMVAGIPTFTGMVIKRCIDASVDQSSNIESSECRDIRRTYNKNHNIIACPPAIRAVAFFGGTRYYN